jgi:hypothetical protein
VVAGQASELGYRQSGLQQGGDHRVVAAADPGGALRDGQQRVWLGAGEPTDVGAGDAAALDGTRWIVAGSSGARSAAYLNIEWIAARRACGSWRCCPGLRPGAAGSR